MLMDNCLFQYAQASVTMHVSCIDILSSSQVLLFFFFFFFFVVFVFFWFTLGTFWHPTAQRSHANCIRLHSRTMPALASSDSMLCLLLFLLGGCHCGRLEPTYRSWIVGRVTYYSIACLCGDRSHQHCFTK